MSTEKEIVDLALVALNSLRSVEIFELIWDETLKDANTLQWTEASSPRKWERPAKILSGKIFQLMMTYVMQRYSTDVSILMSSTR